MLSSELAVYILGLNVVGAPVALLSVLGFFSLIDRPLSERNTDRLVFLAIFTGLLSTLGMIAVLLRHGVWRFTIELESLLDIDHYHFSVKLLFDSLSLPFVLLAFVLCATIGRFASRYLH